MTTKRGLKRSKRDLKFKKSSKQVCFNAENSAKLVVGQDLNITVCYRF